MKKFWTGLLLSATASFAFQSEVQGACIGCSRLEAIESSITIIMALTGASTSFIRNQDTLQTGATFYVSSGTVLNLDARNFSRPGGINISSNPVDWSQLKNVPAGFADGSDDGGGGSGSGDNLGSHVATNTVTIPKPYGISSSTGLYSSSVSINYPFGTIGDNGMLVVRSTGLDTPIVRVLFSSSPAGNVRTAVLVAEESGGKSRLDLIGTDGNVNVRIYGDYISSSSHFIRSGNLALGDSISPTSRLDVINGSITVRGDNAGLFVANVGSASVNALEIRGSTICYGTNCYVMPSTGGAAGQHSAIRNTATLGAFTYHYLIWGGDSAGGGAAGGGSSSLAVGTGSLAATNIISSPTAVVNFDSATFNTALTGGSTAFVSLTPLVSLVGSTEPFSGAKIIWNSSFTISVNSPRFLGDFVLKQTTQTSDVSGNSPSMRFEGTMDRNGFGSGIQQDTSSFSMALIIANSLAPVPTGYHLSFFPNNYTFIGAKEVLGLYQDGLVTIGNGIYNGVEALNGASLFRIGKSTLSIARNGDIIIGSTITPVGILTVRGGDSYNRPLFTVSSGAYMPSIDKQFEITGSSTGVYVDFYVSSPSVFQSSFSVTLGTTSFNGQSYVWPSSGSPANTDLTLHYLNGNLYFGGDAVGGAGGGGGGSGVWAATTAFRFNVPVTTFVFLGDLVSSAAYSTGLASITFRLDNSSIFNTFASTVSTGINFLKGFTSTSDARGDTFVNFRSTTDTSLTNLKLFTTTSDARGDTFVNFRSTTDASLTAFVNFLSTANSKWESHKSTADSLIASFSNSTTIIFNSESPDISARPYYLTNITTGGANAYFVLQSSPSNLAETIKSKSIVAANGLVMLSSHVTVLNDPGTRKIPAGTWSFLTYVDLNSVASLTQMVITVSTISFNFTNEQEIVSSTSSDIEDLSVNPVDIVAVQQNDIAISTSDRILVKYWARTTSALSITVDLYLAGTSHASHLNSPVGAVYKFIQLADAPSTLIGQQGKYVAVNNDQTALVFVSTPTDQFNAVSVATANLFNLLTTTAAELSDNTNIINTAGNPVSWNSLKDVPAGFSDGTDDGGGGGGGSSLAIGTGSAQAVNIISSPTAVISFSSGPFIVKLVSGATAYIDINYSSITAQGTVTTGASGPTTKYIWYQYPATSLLAGGTDFAVLESTNGNRGLIPRYERAFNDFVTGTLSTEAVVGTLMLPPELDISSTVVFSAYVRAKTPAASKNIQLLFKSSATAGGAVNSFSLTNSTGADIVSIPNAQGQWTRAIWEDTVSHLSWNPWNLVEWRLERSHDTSKLTNTELSGDMYMQHFVIGIPVKN